MWKRFLNSFKKNSKIDQIFYFFPLGQLKTKKNHILIQNYTFSTKNSPASPFSKVFLTKSKTFTRAILIWNLKKFYKSLSFLNTFHHLWKILNSKISAKKQFFRAQNAAQVSQKLSGSILFLHWFMTQRSAPGQLLVPKLSLRSLLTIYEKIISSCAAC